MTTILAKLSHPRKPQPPNARFIPSPAMVLMIGSRVNLLRRRYWREAFLAELSDIAAGRDPRKM